MSRKVREKDEVEAILRAFANGSSILEINEKFKISESAFYRLLRVSRGLDAQPAKTRVRSKVEKLEKKLKEREREIALLKAVLKKS